MDFDFADALGPLDVEVGVGPEETAAIRDLFLPGLDDPGPEGLPQNPLPQDPLEDPPDAPAAAPMLEGKPSPASRPEGGVGTDPLVGRLASAVVHRMNNQLASVVGNAGYLRSRVGETPSLRRAAQDLESSAQQMGALVSEVMACSQVGGAEPGPSDLQALLPRLRPLLQAALPPGVILEMQLPEGAILVEAGPRDVRREMLACVLAAQEHFGGRGAGLVRMVVQAGDPVGFTLAAIPSRQPGTPAADTGGTDAAREWTLAWACARKGGDRSLPEAPATPAALAERVAPTRATPELDLPELEPAEFKPAARITGQAPALESTPPDPPRAVGAAAETTGGLQGCAMLVVDDDADVRVALARMLGAMGAEVHLAEDGVAALGYLQDPSFALDVVMLDLFMPGLDGDEVLRAIRRMGIRLPVVLMTGSHTAGQRVQQLHDQGVSVLVKPFHRSALIEHLQAHGLVPRPHSEAGVRPRTRAASTRRSAR